MITRLASVGVLLLTATLTLVLLLGSGGDDEDAYSVTAEFENASQLVGGERVVVGGVAAGLVEEIRLGPQGQALVTFSVAPEFAPLPRGTVATVRSYSISGLANRQVQLTIPATGKDGAEIPDGGTMTQAETVSEVDIDAVFNSLDDRTIRNLKRVIAGLETSFAGVGEQANRGLRYANPLLSTSRAVVGELVSDRSVLRQMLVQTAGVSGALAPRATELSALVADASRAMGALARRRGDLALTIAELPDFLREFNTTAVNLRATLDDLDPLVVASMPVAEQLPAFMEALRSTSRRAVPTVADLDALVGSPGSANDLTELLLAVPPTAEVAVGDGEIGGGDLDCAEADAGDDDFGDGALDETSCALVNSLPTISYLRAYTPELLAWINDFGTSGVYDANGGIGRIAGIFNTFTPSTSTGLPDVTLLPQSPEQQLDSLTVGQNSRCPGSLERDPGDGSTPYTEGGTLNCDPAQVPPGP